MEVGGCFFSYGFLVFPILEVCIQVPLQAFAILSVEVMGFFLGHIYVWVFP
jgi:hypothetical protein